MIIKNYKVDNKNFSFFPENIECRNYSLDLELICMPNILLRELEMILKKYHITINKVLSGIYIQKFFSPEEKDIFLAAKKMIDGHNPNEVTLKDKIKKNEGFFEKFFNFFN